MVEWHNHKKVMLTGAERVVERSAERSSALSRPLLTLSLPRDTGIGSRAAASSLSTAVAIPAHSMQACGESVADLHVRLLHHAASACGCRHGRYSLSDMTGSHVQWRPETLTPACVRFNYAKVITSINQQQVHEME